MALKASEDGRSMKNKACDTDIDKEITGFKYTPAPSGTTLCQMVLECWKPLTVVLFSGQFT